MRDLVAILDECVARGASDLHLEPIGDRFKIRLRIDGVLVASRVAEEIAVAAIQQTSIAFAIADTPPDMGPATTSIESNGQRWRVAATRTIAGIHIVVHRLLDPPNDLASLGLSSDEIALIQRASSRSGFTLFSSLPNHGSSTTYYAAIAATRGSVATLEQTIERRIEGVHQTTWPDRFVEPHELARRLLAHDPDVVGVTPIHDPYSTMVATACARAGLPVVATLASSRACMVPSIMMSLGLEPFAIVGLVRLVVAQRLVRLSCPDCRHRDQAGAELLFDLGVTEPIQPVIGTGCYSCAGTGLAHRIALFEVLEMVPAMRELIVSGGSSEEIATEITNGGRPDMRKRAIALIADGQLSVAEAVGLLC